MGASTGQSGRPGRAEVVAVGVLPVRGSCLRSIPGVSVSALCRESASDWRCPVTEIALSDRTPLAETHTVLQVGSRTFKSGPAGTVISGVAFWGWQIHPLPPDDGDRYLVRTDYDLNILPNAPEAAAVDVGFRFLTPGVAVLDAIPRGVSTMEGPASYILTDHLNFVRSAGGSTQTAWPDGSARPEIPLPALRPAVEIFGVGGPDLKWRHTATSSAPIRVGSHSGWFVLALPASVDLIRDGPGRGPSVPS